MQHCNIKGNSIHQPRSFLLVLIIVLVTSCSVPTKNASEPVHIKELNFPTTQYYDALVAREGDIVALVDGGRFNDLQYYAQEGDQELLPFNFPEVSNCVSPRYYSYESYPDGHLQVWKSCFTENGTLIYLMSYDWLTQQLNEVSGPFPRGTSGASWNPERTKAIAYLDGGFDTRTLYWILGDKYEPMDLVIADKNNSWNLHDSFPDFRANDNEETGTTGRAAWSPDGKTIALFASTDAIGKTVKFDAEYILYFLDPVTLQPVAKVDNIFTPFILSWSPDSTHIAFIGKYGSLNENGIWLYSIKDNSITEVSKGLFQGIVWRPTGNSLVAIKCEKYDVCNKIIEYDLNEVLNKR